MQHTCRGYPHPNHSRIFSLSVPGCHNLKNVAHKGKTPCDKTLVEGFSLGKVNGKMGKGREDIDLWGQEKRREEKGGRE